MSNPNFIGLHLRRILIGRRRQYRLICPIHPDTRVTEYLGVVQAKNDQRWEWIAKQNVDFFPTFNKDKRVQGVAGTLDEALLKLLECVPQHVVLKLRLRNQGSLFEILATKD